MTDRERLAAALATLRWGPAAFASALGIRFDTVKHWLTGRRAVPPDKLVWAETLAACHRAHPPPKLTRDGIPIADEPADSL